MFFWKKNKEENSSKSFPVVFGKSLFLEEPVYSSEQTQQYGRKIGVNEVYGKLTTLQCRAEGVRGGGKGGRGKGILEGVRETMKEERRVGKMWGERRGEQ